MVEQATSAGATITAQVFPRPVGLMVGLDLSIHPFVLYPSYQQIAGLPLAERVAEMRKPEVRQRILADEPSITPANPIAYLAHAWDWMFPLGDDADYEPDHSKSIAARAEARGVSPIEEAYDRLLDDNGHAILLGALANFENNSLDTVGELLRRDEVVLGLGDGGAHYGMICDSSFPTYVLTHWARDRASGRLSVPAAVRELSSVPARVAGLEDRGRIAVGYKADLNVIDHASLRLHKPVVTYDLPAGGRRLDQTADGYVATAVSGEIIAENGKPTAARPGRLGRARQPAPAGELWQPIRRGGFGHQCRVGGDGVTEHLVDAGQQLGRDAHAGRLAVLGHLLGPRRPDQRRGDVVVLQHPGDLQLCGGEPQFVGDRAQLLDPGQHVVGHEPFDEVRAALVVGGARTGRWRL